MCAPPRRLQPLPRQHPTTLSCQNINGRHSVSVSQMDFLIHLFLPDVLSTPSFETPAKNVLKQHKHPLRLLSVSPTTHLPHPPSPFTRQWTGNGGQQERRRTSGKIQIMRCQAGQTIIVNYIYSSAAGKRP